MYFNVLLSVDTILLLADTLSVVIL